MLYFDRDAFRQFVGVQLQQLSPYFGESLRRCFDHSRHSSLDYFALPAVYRFHSKHDIHAGRESVLDEMMRNFEGLVLRPRCGQDDSFVSHIKSAVSSYFAAPDY